MAASWRKSWTTNERANATPRIRAADARGRGNAGEIGQIDKGRRVSAAELTARVARFCQNLAFEESPGAADGSNSRRPHLKDREHSRAVRLSGDHSFIMITTRHRAP